MEFTPPGPGSWELENTHLTRPISTFMGEIFPVAMPEGFRAGTAHYGLLLDYLEIGIVNRFAYLCPRPVGAPKDAKGPPPKFIFKMLTVFHPEMRRRLRRCKEVFQTKAWREDVKLWDEKLKPALIERSRRLQAVDVSAAEIVPHVRECREHLWESIRTHHRLNPSFMVPLGDYLVHASEKTGKSAAELLRPLRGSTPVSAGAVKELAAVKKAFEGRPPQSVEELLQNEAGRSYVDAVGHRIFSGYDVSDKTAIEMPEILLKAIRSDIQRPEPATPELDELLEEARFTHRVRDERVYWGDAWATGLMRRALLEWGRRQKLQDPSHAVEATFDEITSGKFSPKDLADRAAYRTSRTTADAPPILGPAPSGPPPADWLPEYGRRMARAIDAVMSNMFIPSAETPKEKSMKGLAAGAGVYEGTARVVHDISEAGSVQKGDVLVAMTTSPCYNTILPIIGAIVTERGGLLSHAAIVAREFGLPAVVGCPQATRKIKNGMRVRVDGASGEVEILS